MSRIMLLFAFLSCVLTPYALAVSPAWNPFGSESNFQEGLSSNPSLGLLRWGMHYERNGGTASMNGAASRAKLEFEGNTGANVHVSLTFESYADEDDRPTIRHSEIVVFGYNDGSNNIRANNGLPDQGSSFPDNAKWEESYSEASDVPSHKTYNDPGFQYLRLSKGTVSYTHPGGQIDTIFEYDSSNLNNVVGHNTFIVAGCNPVHEEVNPATGRIGKNNLSASASPPIKIRLFIPYALHWHNLSGKWGLKVLGLNSPAQLQIRFYRVSQSYWDGITNTTSITTLGATPSARNPKQLFNTLTLGPSNTYLGNRILRWKDINTAFTDMLNASSRDGANNPVSVTDYRDYRYAYVIHYPFQGGNTKMGPVRKAAEAGGQGDTQDTGFQVIYSEAQGAFY